MKKLLLIIGDLATGKSTFANSLSQRYDTGLFVKDTIKEVLGDTIGFSNRTENLKLSRASTQLMIFFFSEFTKLNKNLILEANFRAAELEKIHQIAEANDYQVLTLFLTGDTEILYPRFLNRIHNENRHPVHVCAEFNTLDGFRNYVEGLRNAEITEPAIRINANDFSYQTDPEVLSKIDAFMRD